MHKNVANLIAIENLLKKKTNKDRIPKIIAVSKTFTMLDIIPLIKHGHVNFGENKIQEAMDKWSSIKNEDTNIKLHMIGKLQSNKVKNALSLFDYIHSLDSLKLAKKISEEQIKIKKKLKIFIQINIGNEHQKSGIKIDNLSSFYQTCINDLGLDIIGLMCLPPNILDNSKYFEEMNKAAKSLSLKELSMGMSSDYLNAVKHNATYVRIGSKIFGERG